MIRQLVNAVFIFTLWVQAAQASTIIYLQGSCSSGKSTFVQALSEEYPKLAIVDEDSIMHEAYVSAVAARFPREFFLIQQVIAPENLYHALREKDIYYKNESSPEIRTEAASSLTFIQEELDRQENLSWKQEVSRSIDREVLRSISAALQDNRDVLLDSWYIHPTRLQIEFPDAKIIRVLLYCSLPKSFERFEARNAKAIEQGNLQEKRYPRQLVGSFFSLYQIGSEPEQPIHKVQKCSFEPTIATLEKYFSGTHLQYNKPVFTFQEPSKALFLQSAQEFLGPFDTFAVDELYIAPKEHQDVIIDNTEGNPAKAIEAVQRYLKIVTLK